MRNRKQLVTDLLFGVQMICGVIFGGSQILRLVQTTQGVNISWFALWEGFILLNLVLAVRAHQAQPSRVTWQTIASYILWAVVVTIALGVMGWNRSGAWDRHDSITAMLAALGIAVTIGIAIRRRIQLADPIVRGMIAVFCKAVPQLALAYKIAMVGGAGLAGAAIVFGHVTVLTRLGQLGFSIHEAGWDRNRLGSAISEVGNEGSWLVTTAIWLVI
ncbi:MAG: hypothetical protein Q7R80_01090 [bacterium]|nr:hypothetical protein [bacterium]